MGKFLLKSIIALSFQYVDPIIIFGLPDAGLVFSMKPQVGCFVINTLRSLIMVSTSCANKTSLVIVDFLPSSTSNGPPRMTLGATLSTGNTVMFRSSNG